MFCFPVCYKNLKIKKPRIVIFLVALVAYIGRGTKAGGVWEYGADEIISAYVGRGNRGVEEAA